MILLVCCLPSVVISATKEGIKFSVSGELGTGNVHIRPSSDVDSKVT